MNNLNPFDANVYSEELYVFTEEEHAEVMKVSAVEDELPFTGYSDWSEPLESPEGDLENFAVVNGSLRYKGEGIKRRPSIGGIEI